MMSRFKFRFLNSGLMAGALALFGLLGLNGAAMADLVVVTDRPAGTYARQAGDFAKKTGIKIKFITGEIEGLVGVIGGKSADRVDLVFFKDVAVLAELLENDLLQSGLSAPSLQRLPDSLRDDQQRWSALTLRVRTLVYNPAMTDVTRFNSYSDLARAPKGSLCLRTSQSKYNVALAAGLIAQYGEIKAQEILSGWVQAQGRDVYPNDTSLLNDLARGECDLGLVNHYYLARLLAQNPQFPVGIKFLEQPVGILTNGSGVALAKTSQQKELANQFIESLYTDLSQQEISAAHFEYPAVRGILASTLIKDWDRFAISKLNWNQIAALTKKSKDMLKAVGYK